MRKRIGRIHSRQRSILNIWSHHCLCDDLASESPKRTHKISNKSKWALLKARHRYLEPGFTPGKHQATKLVLLGAVRFRLFKTLTELSQQTRPNKLSRYDKAPTFCVSSHSRSCRLPHPGLPIHGHKWILMKVGSFLASKDVNPRAGSRAWCSCTPNGDTQN